MAIKYKYWLWMLVLPVLTTCNKDKDYKLLGPGIILTTDVPPHHWFDVRDYLKSKNARVTFYIQSYQLIDSAGRAQLKIMMQDGHEMAHHTYTHIHADKYLYSYTIDDYMQNEIFNMDSIMNADGVYTETFAYPYGDFTEQTDRFLLKRFRSIRKIISPYAHKKLADVDQIYYRFNGVRVFYGCTIDKKQKLALKEVFEALDKAKSSRQAISLYCHRINKGELEHSDQLNVDYEDFKAIVDYASKIGLKFYTAKEISR
ncbi:MAG: hypothetical protein EAY81_08835 [Bacteroidetes bacterium]|nr:MAG: hypothetical protein EAY81_08835 [Bacteroidota bacterium]